MAKFAIEWGVPEMEEIWKDLTGKADNGTLAGDELRLFKKLVKTATLLAENPTHPGLSSHEISSLTERYGLKVWQSYLENRTPAAGRIFGSTGRRAAALLSLAWKRTRNPRRAEVIKRFLYRGQRLPARQGARHRKESAETKGLAEIAFWRCATGNRETRRRIARRLPEARRGKRVCG